MKIGRVTINASRWPWQGYGWSSTGGPTALLNRSGARFGGGWRWKLGISIGDSSLMFELLFGIISVSIEDKTN